MLPVSLSRENSGFAEIPSPYASRGPAVHIDNAPSALASLPQTGTMLVRFCRDRAVLDTSGSVPRLSLQFTIEEVLEVTACESCDESEEDKKEDAFDALFKAAKAEEAELPGDDE